MMKTNRAGFYLHVPFCKKKCIYCDFPSRPGCSEEWIRHYFQTVEREIHLLLNGIEREFSGKEILSSASDGSEIDHRLFQSAGEVLPADSLFFGGGTPSLADPDSIRSILSVLPLTDDAEITLEANPGTLSLKKLEAFRSCGVNRLSLGVQSFNDSELSFLGRIHSSTEAAEAVHEIRKAGFDNLNIDLIFGFPGQTLESWKQSLQKAVDLEPEHLSFYSLQIEEGTPLYQMFREGDVEQIPDEVNREMYHFAVHYLKKNGFRHYEISNAALPGRECRHNLKYWNMVPYIGLGSGAHSFLGDFRYSSPASVEEYLQLIPELEKSGSFFHSREEWLEQNTEEDLRSDYLFTGLRLTEGIDLHRFEEECGIDFRKQYGKPLEKHLKEGTLELQEGFLRLTEKGRDLSNYVLLDFI